MKKPIYNAVATFAALCALPASDIMILSPSWDRIVIFLVLVMSSFFLFMAANADYKETPPNGKNRTIST